MALDRLEWDAKLASLDSERTTILKARRLHEALTRFLSPSNSTSVQVEVEGPGASIWLDLDEHGDDLSSLLEVAAALDETKEAVADAKRRKR